MKPEDIHKEIDRTLQSLDVVDKARPRPFFYTRLKARLEKDGEKSTQIALPLLRLAAALFFLINISTALLIAKQNDILSEEPIETLSEEYFGQGSTFYSFTSELLEYEQ